MNNILCFLDDTESAVQHLFDGLNYYSSLLNNINQPMFVVDRTESGFPMDEYNNWYVENKKEIDRAEEATHRYLAEVFAQNTLAGSILHIAAKAIEMYSTNSAISPEAETFIKKNTKAVKFCIGPVIREVNKGLIILAGRNQHAHFNDSTPHILTLQVFDKLANNNSAIPKGIKDGCFDLARRGSDSFASNVLNLLGWTSYKIYREDLVNMLSNSYN